MNRVLFEDVAGADLSRLEWLEREELRLLAVGVGEHLPVEIAERVADIRRERSLYEPGLQPA